MDLANARQLASELPPDALVIDVGGGAGAFPRADWVIDALPFDQAGAGSSGNIHKQMQMNPRYAPERWIQTDLCDRAPWPIADKQFDFAVCSHLLEDVRDPIWICSEISRIAKAGYIEVPSRIEEQSLGVEHPRYCGYYHHRWLISVNQGVLEFRHKPHNLHSIRDAIVTRLAVDQRISQPHAICTVRWNGGLKANEVMEFNEARLIAELCDFAASAKRLDGLTTQRQMKFTDKLKRRLHRFKLSRGLR